MKTLVRTAAVVSMLAALVGVSTLVTAKGRPAPPPPALCGCLCPDGSFFTTHAPDEDSCDEACAIASQSFCLQDM
jgi:hypothetical protein